MSTYAMGGVLVACVRVRTMGRGSNFYHFDAHVLIE